MCAFFLVSKNINAKGAKLKIVYDAILLKVLLLFCLFSSVLNQRSRCCMYKTRRCLIEDTTRYDVKGDLVVLFIRHYTKKSYAIKIKIKIMKVQFQFKNTVFGKEFIDRKLGVAHE